VESAAVKEGKKEVLVATAVLKRNREERSIAAGGVPASLRLLRGGQKRKRER